MTRPLQRKRLLDRVYLLARKVGAAEATGMVDGHTLRVQQRAQAKASQAGCPVCDVVDATLDGIAAGYCEGG